MATDKNWPLGRIGYTEEILELFPTEAGLIGAATIPPPLPNDDRSEIASQPRLHHTEGNEA